MEHLIVFIYQHAWVAFGLVFLYTWFSMLLGKWYGYCLAVDDMRKADIAKKAARKSKQSEKNKTKKGKTKNVPK